jgi:arylsulfatase A
MSWSYKTRQPIGLVLFALTSLACLADTLAAEGRRSPNIIFILADDLGYGDLGSYGQQHIRTPHLDRMAAEGMRFTRHYSGSAVCAPSRCVLMTGLHPGHAVVRNNHGMASKKFVDGRPETEGQFPIPDDSITIPELLAPLGYTSGGFGKWGLGGPDSTGAPLRQGFDRWFGYNCQSVAHNFFPTYLWDNDRVIPLPNPPFSAHDTFANDEDPNDPASYRRFQGEAYSADLIAEQALQFIRDNKQQPFFLYWPTTVPHVALQVPDDSLAEYDGDFEDPPYQGGRGYIPHFKPRAAYAAMITRMDREIGRAIDLIAELGLDEDTIFIFTSDNGPLHGTHEGLAGTDSLFFNSHAGLRDGKGTLYEGGIRVPCIVRWPKKVAAGSVSDRVSSFEDWLPTLLELAGAKPGVPDKVDGIGMAATLLGNAQPERDFLYREFAGYGGQQSVHAGNWKAIRSNLNPRPRDRGLAPKTELYDLANDPAEAINLAQQHPDVVQRLELLMTREHRPSKDFPMVLLDRP